MDQFGGIAQPLHAPLLTGHDESVGEQGEIQMDRMWGDAFGFLDREHSRNVLTAYRGQEAWC